MEKLSLGTHNATQRNVAMKKLSLGTHNATQHNVKGIHRATQRRNNKIPFRDPQRNTTQRRHASWA